MATPVESGFFALVAILVKNHDPTRNGSLCSHQPSQKDSVLSNYVSTEVKKTVRKRLLLSPHISGLSNMDVEREEQQSNTADKRTQERKMHAWTTRGTVRNHPHRTSKKKSCHRTTQTGREANTQKVDPPSYNGCVTWSSLRSTTIGKIFMKTKKFLSTIETKYPTWRYRGYTKDRHQKCWKHRTIPTPRRTGHVEPFSDRRGVDRLLDPRGGKPYIFFPLGGHSSIIPYPTL